MAWIFGDGHGCGCGQFVARAGDEVLETVSRVQTDGCGGATIDDFGYGGGVRLVGSLRFDVDIDGPRRSARVTCEVLADRVEVVGFEPLFEKAIRCAEDESVFAGIFSDEP